VVEVTKLSIKDGVKLHNLVNDAQTISSVWGVALPIIVECHAPYRCVVTSAFDGQHKPGSLHYVGRALDFRIWDVPSEERADLAAHIRDRLGPDFDVVLEANHIHIEYDPK